MSEPFADFQVEFEALRAKHGIENYLLIAKSPFNDDTYTRYSGSSAWIAGQALFTSDLMAKRWNADRL